MYHAVFEGVVFLLIPQGAGSRAVRNAFLVTALWVCCSERSLVLHIDSRAR